MEIIDDDLMSMMFDGNIEATELLLKIILKQDDIQVESVVGQREFQSPVVGGRDIRLDIWAKDGTGKHYNVEVQQKPEGAHIHRARFNSSMMDARMLKEGQDFSKLQDSYMVFITRTDIFGQGIPVYTINRRFEETKELCGTVCGAEGRNCKTQRFVGFHKKSHVQYEAGSRAGDESAWSE